MVLNFTAMLNMLDEAFKNITDTLTVEGYDDNLLIVFTSDVSIVFFDNITSFPGVVFTLY